MRRDRKKWSKENRFMKWIRSLIPHYATNKQVLGFLSFNTWIRFPKKFIFSHYGENLRKLTEAGRGGTDRQEAFYQSNTYIENQCEWGSIDFGITNMAYAGCEIMAVYNARLSLGEDMTAKEMAGLIRTFEKRGAVLGGIFGTAPAAMYKYFRDTGYHAGITTGTPEDEINAFGEEYDTAIITFFNDRDDIKGQVHTVNVSKERGGFVCHNTRLDETGGNICRSLAEAVRRVACGKARLISIIGVDRRGGYSGS